MFRLLKPSTSLPRGPTHQFLLLPGVKKCLPRRAGLRVRLRLLHQRRIGHPGGSSVLNKIYLVDHPYLPPHGHLPTKGLRISRYLQTLL